MPKNVTFMGLKINKSVFVHVIMNISIKLFFLCYLLIIINSGSCCYFEEHFILNVFYFFILFYCCYFHHCNVFIINRSVQFLLYSQCHFDSVHRGLFI